MWVISRPCSRCHVNPPAVSLVSAGSSDRTQVSLNQHTPSIIQHRRWGLLPKSLLRFTALISHLLFSFTGVLNYAALRAGVELQVDTGGGEGRLQPEWAELHVTESITSNRRAHMKFDGWATACWMFFFCSFLFPALQRLSGSTLWSLLSVCSSCLRRTSPLHQQDRTKWIYFIIIFIWISYLLVFRPRTVTMWSTPAACMMCILFGKCITRFQKTFRPVVIKKTS